MTDFSIADIDRIFEKALELPTEERIEFVKKSCNNNSELEAQVLKLVTMQGSLGTFLEGDAEKIRDSLYADISTEWSNQSNDRINSQVGQFKIVKEIGRGGGATVYQGLREEQDWKQLSAIKILRRGLDTDDVLQRFHSERQILTNLKHPGIVSIQDAGVTDDGLPWFAMELVDGQNIYEYCQTNNLNLKQRLRIFLKILDVISFAHRNLVVHRDIKPSNILLTGDGKVMLLDFGISKVLEGSNEEIIKSHTRTNIYLATLDYAAPEQITGKNITTATDIYQLGLLLCKILTGRLPIIDSGKVAEIKTIVKPSDLEGEKNCIDSKLLKGDIDTLILKTIREIPENRYASTDALIKDIQRVLENRPIEAQPPTLTYKLKKFFKRQPWALPLGLLATIGMISYVVTINLYNQQLQVERDLKAAEVVRAEEIKSFLVDFLRAPDPYEGEGINLTMQQALDNAAEKAQIQLVNNPALQTEIYGTLASVYKNLDLHHQAIDLRNKQLSSLQSMANVEQETINVRRERADSMFEVNGQDEAIKELLDIKSHFQNQPPKDRSELIKVNNALSRFEFKNGMLNQAEKYIEESVLLSRTTPEIDPYLLANTLILANKVKLEKGEYQQALSLLNRAEVIYATLFDENALQNIQLRLSKANIMTILADNLEQALSLYLDASVQYKKLLGDTHSKTFSALSGSAVALGRLGRYTESEKTYRQILQIRLKKSDGKPSLEIAQNMADLAVSLLQLKQFDDAATMALRGRSMLLQISEAKNIGFGYIDLTLGNIYQKSKKYKQMELVYKRAIGIFDPIMARGNSVREIAECKYGLSLLLQEKTKQGRQILEDSIAIMEETNVAESVLNVCKGYLASVIKL